MSKFTTQHYRAVAAVLNEVLMAWDGQTREMDDFELGSNWAVTMILEKLSDLFEKDNPKFKPCKFREAAMKGWRTPE